MLFPFFSFFKKTNTYKLLWKITCATLILFLSFGSITQAFATTVTAQGAKSKKYIPAQGQVREVEFERPKPRISTKNENKNSDISQVKATAIPSVSPAIEISPVPETTLIPPVNENLVQNLSATDSSSVEASTASTQINWSLVGSAMLLNNLGEVELTPDNYMASGAAWNPEQLDLKESFDKTFKVYLGARNDQYGADGIVFVLQNTGTNVLGNLGGQLGFGGIGPSIGVELDDYYNQEYNDPLFGYSQTPSDHIAIDLNGSTVHANTPYMDLWNDIEDGQKHTFRIIWDAPTTTLYTYLDNQLFITYTDDIVNTIFSGNSLVWYGLLGATGSGINWQYFSESPSSVPPESVYAPDCGSCLASYDNSQAIIGGAPGISTSQVREGGSINTNNGAYSYSATDLSFESNAGTVSFRRTYSSLTTSTFTKPLGLGWSHNHDLKLTFLPDGTFPTQVMFKDPSGNQYLFYVNSDGITYTAAPGVNATLTKDGFAYLLKDKDQNIYTFDYTMNAPTSKLLSYQDANNHKITYTYDSKGRLSTISADNGSRYLSLRYNSSNYITSVTDHTGRSVTYSYDTSGRQTSIKDVFQKTWTYTYTNNNLSQITDPDSKVVERVEYDAQGRAYRLFTGTATSPIYEIVYNSDGTATVKDGIGNTSTHQYDSRHTLTGKSSALSEVVTQTYNGNFQPTSITNPLGNTTKLTWSPNGGNLTKLVDPAGNQLSMKYNPQDNTLLETVDQQNFITSYTYEGTNVKTIDYPLEGVTRAYSYTPDGYLALETDPNQNTTTYEYNAYGEVTSIKLSRNTNATINTYDSLGRLTDTKNPLGRITHYEYDVAGRLIKVVENYDSARPQNDQNKYNLTTLYQYDSRNHLIAQTDTYGVIVRTYYDDAGRAVTVVKNLTGKVITDPTPPDRSAGGADENIRTDTYYDKNGNVIAQVDPLGIVNRTYYDSDNRAVTEVQNLVGKTIDDVTPPIYNLDLPDQNVRTDTVYDKAGNIIATIDKNGKIDRTYYDVSNRPIVVVQNLKGQLVSDPNPPSRSSSTASTNRVSETQYDASGNAIATIDPAGVITRTYYDAMNRPISVVINLKGQDIAMTEPPARGSGAADENIRTDTYYDNNGNAIATVDPLGTVTRDYYDAANRVVTTVENLVGQDIYVVTPPQRGTGNSNVNVRVDHIYDENGNQVETVDALGRTTKYGYNEANQLSNMTVNVMAGQSQNYLDQYNLVTNYTYNAQGRLLTTTDTLGKITATSYDKLGRVVQKIENQRIGQPQNYQNEYNLVSSLVYDKGGNQIGAINTSGMITRTYYDALNRQVTMVQNLTGQPVSATVPPERITPPSNLQNLRVDTHYDGNGNADRITDAMGKTRVYGFDDMGRRIREEDALSYATQYQYNLAGNTSLKIDRNQVQTAYEYDALGRVTAVIENKLDDVTPDNKVNLRTEYGYDKQGNRLFIRDANAVLHNTGDITVYTYDYAGRVKTEIDPLGNQSTYSYDSIGNRISLLDGNGKTTNFVFDALNRLTKIDYPAPDSDINFTYNPAGWRKTMSDEQGTTTWNYNTLGQIRNIIAPTGTVEYGYDERGNRVSIKYPNQQIYSSTFDALNRLTQLTGGSLPGALIYKYDAVGRVIGITRPNGINSDYSFDDAGHILSISHSKSGMLLSGYHYTYDPEGNRKTAVEQHVDSGFISSGAPKVMLNVLAGKSTSTPTRMPTSTLTPTITLTPTVTFTPTITQTPTVTPTATVAPTLNSLTITYNYDAISRLERADYSDGLYFQYTYDATGNRLTQETQSGLKQYQYDVANRLTSIDGVPFTWDANGNLMTDGENTYTYDIGNHMTGVTNATGSVGYQYNGLGDRTGETLNGIHTAFVLDLNASLVQVLQDGSVTYIYGNERVAQVSDNDTGYFLTDAIGSVRDLVNNSGELKLTRRYDPYGNLITSIGSGSSPYGFTGEWASSSTNLLYLRARYYSASMGRFINRDRWKGNFIRPKTLNYWNYAESNPIKYTDPTGMYVYDRYKAVTYALEWDHQSGLDPEYDFTGKAPDMDWSNQCTIYASSVLHYGGVRDPREDPIKAGKTDDPQKPYWDLSVMKAGGWEYAGYYMYSPWFNTTSFYNFTSKVIGTTVLSYQNPPQLMGNQLYGQNAPSDPTKERNWLNALRSVRSQITEGDLVFYGSSDSSWDHVAVIVGWGLPTTFSEKSNPGSGPSGGKPLTGLPPTVDMLRNCNNHWMEYYPSLPLRPLVVERSGGIEYTSWRSLDNTFSPVSLIKIVHIENR